jgi:hypothetical protein
MAVGLLVLGGCSPGDDPKAEDEQPFHRELLQVAKEYEDWGRVDDDMRFAPQYCAMPNPSQAYVSRSTDADTHGQKLYSLFAKNRQEYRTFASPVGQAIVKQSWVPEEVTDVKPGDVDSSKVIRTGQKHENRFYPYATKGDKVYRAAKPAGLFIMLKLDPKTPGTDDGWVYGTVSADGKTVTSAGRVESCMKCHQDAKHDRLFGLPAK